MNLATLAVQLLDEEKVFALASILEALQLLLVSDHLCLLLGWRCEGILGDALTKSIDDIAMSIFPSTISNSDGSALKMRN